MPDEDRDNLGHQTPSDGSNAPVTDNANGGTFFENFKSPEEVCKAYKELQQKLGKQGSELGELRQKLSTLSTQDKLADVLGQMTEKLDGSKKERPTINFEEFATSLGDEFAERPQEAAKKLLAAVNSWQMEESSKVQGYTDECVKKLEGMVGQLVERMETLDDDYRTNKDIIDKLKESGMSLSQAKKVAKDIVASLPEERRVPPSGIQPTRNVVTNVKVIGLTDDEKARMKAVDGLSDEAIAILDEKYKKINAKKLQERK